MTTRLPPALRRRVLKEIEPSPEQTQQARRLARDLAQRIRKLATQRGLRLEPRLVGSLAKDTHLAYPLDIDLFLLFPPTTAREQLEKEGLALGKAVLPRPVLKYAEHPYVHGRVQGFNLDIVPAYKLRRASERMSAVDRTPFHTAYVRQHATARLRQEIRLLKRFLRGTQCYGAETAVGGVSGYLAELLVLKYGTFARTLDAIAAWKPPVELTLEGPPQPLGGPLVVVDPVDVTRNAAAAVSASTLERLQRAARAFRPAPRWEFFFPNLPTPRSRAQLESLLKDRSVLGWQGPAPAGRQDTRLPQAHRLLSKFQRALVEEGFQVLRAEAHLLPKARLLLLLEHEPAELSATYEHRGPPIADAANAERFRRKWMRHPARQGPVREEAGRSVVTVRRARRTPAALLRPRLRELLGVAPRGRRGGAPVRLLSGRTLATTPERRLPLTLFLQRLDPWDA